MSWKGSCHTRGVVVRFFFARGRAAQTGAVAQQHGAARVSGACVRAFLSWPIRGRSVNTTLFFRSPLDGRERRVTPGSGTCCCEPTRGVVAGTLWMSGEELFFCEVFNGNVFMVMVLSWRECRRLVSARNFNR